MQVVEEEQVEVDLLAWPALTPRKEATLPQQTMAGGRSPSSSSDVITNFLAG